MERKDLQDQLDTTVDRCIQLDLQDQLDTTVDVDDKVPREIPDHSEESEHPEEKDQTDLVDEPVTMVAKALLDHPGQLVHPGHEDEPMTASELLVGSVQSTSRKE